MEGKFGAIVMAAVAVASLAGSGLALAHPLSPALLELREGADGSAVLRWKIARDGLAAAGLRPVIEEPCELSSPRSVVPTIDSITTTWTVDCGGQGLVGKTVGVEGFEPRKVDVLLRAVLADGRLVQGVLSAREPYLLIPRRQGRLEVLAAYGRLGVKHILGGLDHLFFVFGLLLLVGNGFALVKTVTAFTAGHSVTLSFAALSVATIPPGPVEFAISATVFWLAVDLSRDPSSPPTLLRRFPWAMALLFGLLHGLGFAGALAEIGLPQEEIPAALFSFNAGIEFGQLAFVMGVLVLRRVVGLTFVELPLWAKQAPVYCLGSFAAYWCMERAVSLLE